MSLAEKINNDIKEAMKAKDKEKLDALRAVKSAILLAGTEKGASDSLSADAEFKLLSKLVKQRKEAAELFIQQGRQDLADVEISQAAMIEVYLPKMMTKEEVETIISEIKSKIGANAPSDMGKLIGAAMKELQGKADGKMVSDVAKSLLSA